MPTGVWAGLRGQSHGFGGPAETSHPCAPRLLQLLSSFPHAGDSFRHSSGKHLVKGSSPWNWLKWLPWGGDLASFFVPEAPLGRLHIWDSTAGQCLGGWPGASVVWRHLPWAWVMEVGTSCNCDYGSFWPCSTQKGKPGCAWGQLLPLTLLGLGGGGICRAGVKPGGFPHTKPKEPLSCLPSAPGALLDSQLSHILTGASLEPHLFMVP